jgi:multicomponent Na+:H+ antiporter subunit C
MTASVLGIYNYWIYVLLMMIGLYGVIAKPNLIKQAIALGLFQTGIFLYYISMAVIDGGTAPVWTTIQGGAQKFEGPYDNPLPHVLILTAIVVSVSVLAVALALIINIKRRYGTIEADEIDEIDQADRLAEYAAGQAFDAADEAEAEAQPAIRAAAAAHAGHAHPGSHV